MKINNKKFNYFCFSVFNIYYIFDGLSQSVIAVNKNTWKTLKEIKLAKNVIIPNSQTKKFIDLLFKKSYLQTYKTDSAPNFYYTSNMLSLVHTQRCNLNCKYCFAKQKNKNFDMTLETARNSINKFLTKFAKIGNSITIDLTGAGEPLLNKEFLINIITYISELRNKGLNISAALITNGMLLNTQWADFFEKNKVFWAISLDGDKEHHEYSRKGADYNKITLNYLSAKKKIKTKWLHYGIRATYHSENCNLIEIFESLYRIGFDVPITINPARNSKNSFGKTLELK